ncbi:MAG: hypothetical protein AAB553_05090 [Patescibacteria group bacterium]
MSIERQPKAVSLEKANTPEEVRAGRVGRLISFPEPRKGATMSDEFTLLQPIFDVSRRYGTEVTLPGLRRDERSHITALHRVDSPEARSRQWVMEGGNSQSILSAGYDETGAPYLRWDRREREANGFLFTGGTVGLSGASYEERVSDSKDYVQIEDERTVARKAKHVNFHEGVLEPADGKKLTRFPFDPVQS